MFSAFNNVSTVPAGSFENASFVGAKTVNGPSEFRVATRSAAFTAATKVLKFSFEAATPTIVGSASLLFLIGSLLFAKASVDVKNNIPKVIFDNVKCAYDFMKIKL